MERQDYLVAAASFILAAGIGFAGHQAFFQEQKFSEDLSLRVDSETQTASTEFDGHKIELRYEDAEEAKFYFKYNDSRGVQQLRGLEHDGTLRTTRKIRSFGKDTYFLYLRYKDDPEKSEDGFLELYRIEKT
jgi:hypothetical protein